ncbi:MAG: hypothetical protein H0V66_01870 [Bdellovibrionales bacterium]|nr:hypothetical protein [Bdellovibrionales bacterium]
MGVNKNTKALSALANSIGDFIRYWGFRRIHGQIWTIVYLSKTPMSGVELVAHLKVSKALVSPAIKELEKYRLILKVKAENSKTKRYIANPEVFQVIKEVLISRELRILHQINSNVELLNKVMVTAPDTNLDQQRLENLDEMVKSANTVLGAFIKIESEETLTKLATLLSYSQK